ncbi:unnamed protein product [Cuscuta campestris]|uniref:Wings apart-like protein C-terminal domain-containing protein n=1 Tax=Cuscuta campestris TaxID=132261 RepID=A0A484MI97_9ASTE|nr:unnamed protein product [Cuscuta campestris]
MIVRTYGRRGRGVPRSYSGARNGFEDGVSSQESPQDVYNFEFSSQDSGPWASSLNGSDPYGIGSSQECHDSKIFMSEEGDLDVEDRNGHWKSKKKMRVFDWDPYSSNSSQESDELVILSPKSARECGDFGKSKKAKPGKKAKENGVLQKKKMNTKVDLEEPESIAATLMETQEHGEMMENVDEVNFALDGLRKGQPVRIRRASLLSLLSICGTVHQRRLLRVHGVAQRIVDAVVGLPSDDSSSNLAAGALFYIFISDGRDDHLLDSPGCICFLIKLLKPVKSVASVEKAQTIGSKLLAIRLDADVSQDLMKGTDSTSNSINKKVQEILVSCKEMNPICDNDRSQILELNPKWISLLTMEKACLSTISIEDTSGTVRKSGSTFKEKLRELGGLDAVFEVARNCHSVLEEWMMKISSSYFDAKDTTVLEGLVLLLKCLKTMENATFLSMDNQNHLLEMKGKMDSLNSARSFTKLILSVIGTLSGVYLHRRSSENFQDNKISRLSVSHSIGDSKDIFSIISSLSTSEGASSSKCFTESQTDQLGSSNSTLEGTTTAITDSWWSKTRIDSSTFGSCSGSSGHNNAGTKNNTSNVNNFDKIRNVSNESKVFGLVDDTQDPFAFDDEDFGPSKWDLLSGKQKVSQPKSGRGKAHRHKDMTQSSPMLSQQESSSHNHNKSSSCEASPSCSSAVGEEMSNLLADCLLTAVKVLMNLTNDNSIGCQQIAACGGLETLACLIAGHFPSFSSSLEHVLPSKPDTKPGHQIDSLLSDQELDFLVAILGLLVNLVEKDGHNRSRLARASVSLPGIEGLEGSCTDVIPLLCSIFLANQGAGEAAGEGTLTLEDEDALLKGQKEAEKMIVEAYAALLIAFLSTESQSTRNAITKCLPDRSLGILVPVLERFVDFHLSLNMISPETHSTVLEVIESCRVP